MNYLNNRNLLKLALAVMISVIASSCDLSSTPTPAGTEPQNITDISETADLTVTKENGGGPSANEGSMKLIDGDKYTKFFLGGYTTDFWVQQTFDMSVGVNAYTMTAGNDAPDRDPKDWKLEGSNDGNSWTVLDTKTDATFDLRNKTNIYYLDSQVSYQYYRLNITANAGSGNMQLSEWRLLNYDDIDKESSAPADTISENNKLRIDSISPVEGESGSQLTIQGVNFSSSASENTVKIGGTKASIVDATSRELKVTIPANLSLKTYGVYVMANGQQAATPHALNVIKEFIPTSMSEGHAWTYTDYVPNYQDLAWTKSSYDDSGWQSDEAPFGSGYDGTRTNWTGWDIYLRKTFTIDNLSALKSGEGELFIEMEHDDWANVYINGVKAVGVTGANGSYDDFSLSPESMDALQEGENILAVHTHENGGGQFIDLGLLYK